MASPTQGGFILSPPLSYASSNATSALPHPRSSPLRPGGNKESSFIRFVDQQMLHIQRRFAKRDSLVMPEDSTREVKDMSEQWHDVQGYKNMAEACRDVESVMGVIWVSGTPTLQVPYLISLALLVSTTIPAFPPSPRPLFRLLSKLDHAFASLLQGHDIDTGETLPGFSGRKGVSGTEKVRIRSLVERTRVAVVEAMKAGEFDEDEVDETDADKMETDDDDLEGGLVLEGDDHEETEEDSWDMQIARVYDRTIVELGETLEAPSIGIITESRG